MLGLPAPRLVAYGDAGPDLLQACSKGRKRQFEGVGGVCGGVVGGNDWAASHPHRRHRVARRVRFVDVEDVEHTALNKLPSGPAHLRPEGHTRNGAVVANRQRRASPCHPIRQRRVLGCGAKHLCVVAHCPENRR